MAQRNEAAKLSDSSLRLLDVDMSQLAADLADQGWSRIPKLFTEAECTMTQGLYGTGDFRATVNMNRHGFGSGEYKYFGHPLPIHVQDLRQSAYTLLVAIANEWQDKMDRRQFPKDYNEFLADCHNAGQIRPTPLLLRYAQGDYNRLHQDLYGEFSFPLQLAILLSDPTTDFDGGEFVVTEQKPRSQSKVSVVPLQQGDGVVFAVNERPVQGSRGPYRVRMRHGVSVLRSGERMTLGVILHEAS